MYFYHYMSAQFKENILHNMVKRKGILLKIPDYSSSWEHAYQKWFKYQKRKKIESKKMSAFINTKKGKEVAQTTIHSKKSMKKKEKDERKKELDDAMELTRTQSDPLPPTGGAGLNE